MTSTKTSTLIAALKSGKELTASQITSKFGLSNPTATISTLRSQGYAIYLNSRNGTSSYRLGKPTRKMIAAGYAALGAQGNETSGRAFYARQAQGEVSTFNFMDNMAKGHPDEITAQWLM